MQMAGAEINAVVTEHDDDWLMSGYPDAREQAKIAWNPHCLNCIVPEGDRAGVMRAYGITWIPESCLAKYKIGFDYTHRVDLLEVLHWRYGIHDEEEFFIFFDLDMMEWVVPKIHTHYHHYGDLHVADVDTAFTDEPEYIVFFSTLLVEKTANFLLNAVARAKDRWLRRRCRRHATQNLNTAGQACKKFLEYFSRTEVRWLLHHYMRSDLAHSIWGKACTRRVRP